MRDRRQKIEEFIFFKANELSCLLMGTYLVFVHNFDKLTFHLLLHSNFISSKNVLFGENFHETFPIWQF